MFRLYASDFAEILEARPVSSDLRSILRGNGKSNERFAVLDLGCGTGRLLRPLSELATVVVGLDYSPELLSVAARTAQKLSNIVLVRGDARHLTDLFPRGEFDAVVRAYTSLGYFPRHIESKILKQCATISRPGAKVLVDCFNQTWFAKNKVIARTSSLKSFTLEETYEWDDKLQVISCLWRYVRPTDIAEIQFSLDGYDVDAVSRLLWETGWQPTAFFDDLTSCQHVDAPTENERIVAVATRRENGTS